jgi:putative ABC transport system permease protein
LQTSPIPESAREVISMMRVMPQAFVAGSIASAIGIVLGIPLGMAICGIMVYAYDTELYRLPYHIERSSYAAAALVSALFVIIANIAMWRRIQQLDLVEVLKERE